MFFIVDIWTFITVKLIWGILRLAWFLTRTVFWLVVLLIASVAQTVRKHSESAQVPGAGDFTAVGQDYYWRDDATGTLYQADPDYEETCEVQASERVRMDLRMTAASSLIRGPAIDTNRFTAVSDATGQLAASTDFPQQCYRGIGLDHVDPAQAAQDQCDLRFNREQATEALDRLESTLEAQGWQRYGNAGAHWYSRTYQRPAILWDQPVHEEQPPAILAPTT
jgi:hypothetical protein